MPIYRVGATLAVVPGPRHACRGGLPQGQPLRGDSRVECRMVKRPQDNQTEGRRQAHRPTMTAAPRFHCHEKDARRDTPPGVSGPHLYALPRGEGGPKGRVRNSGGNLQASTTQQTSNSVTTKTARSWRSLPFQNHYVTARIPHQSWHRLWRYHDS